MILYDAGTENSTVGDARGCVQIQGYFTMSPLSYSIDRQVSLHTMVTKQRLCKCPYAKQGRQSLESVGFAEVWRVGELEAGSLTWLNVGPRKKNPTAVPVKGGAWMLCANTTCLQ